MCCWCCYSSLVTLICPLRLFFFDFMLIYPNIDDKLYAFFSSFQVKPKQTLGHLITSLTELLALFASTSFMLNQDA